ncbi:MAG: ATP-grasp domain-containing protein [Oscillospiraceae bacterium]|nr:ATP-grasp domain-containing protein [Oscillospiraceae bacterium]
MNFIFISPQFPHTYWNFCDRLRRNGVNVLGIGDAPYDTLEEPLKRCLTEYYRVDNMEDYTQMFRAVAFFSFKYGKIDWLESNNEYWLGQDARLRTDFHITTGAGEKEAAAFKSKSGMKAFYAKAGVPTARCHRIKTRKAAEEFCKEVGWPVIVKPDTGVGANDTYRLDNKEQFDAFFENLPAVPYVIEEFITGDIVSYDAITDAGMEPVFESMGCFPPSIMDIVNEKRELAYCVANQVPEALAKLGRATVKAFRVRSRFVHFEFFRLTRDKKGLGKKGDYVGLEVNMRPAGGYTPDMMNYAHSTDVYQIWADMVAAGRRLLPPGNGDCFCVYASRRDGKSYVHTHEEILSRYGGQMVMCERMPEIISGAMGNQMYTVRASDGEAAGDFVRFVTERVQ